MTDEDRATLVRLADTVQAQHETFVKHVADDREAFEKVERTVHTAAGAVGEKVDKLRGELNGRLKRLEDEKIARDAVAQDRQSRDERQRGRDEQRSVVEQLGISRRSLKWGIALVIATVCTSVAATIVSLIVHA